MLIQRHAMIMMDVSNAYHQVQTVFPSSFSFPKKSVIHNNKTLFSLLSWDGTGHPDHYKKNKNFRRCAHDWKTRKLELDPIVSKWVEPRKKINTHQTTLFIVISSKKNSAKSIDQKSIQSVRQNQQNKYFVPFLSSSMNKASPFVIFHCLSQQDLTLLKKKETEFQLVLLEKNLMITFHRNSQAILLSYYVLRMTFLIPVSRTIISPAMSMQVARRLTLLTIHFMKLIFRMVN